MCFDLCRCSMPFAAMRKAAMAAGAVAGGAAAQVAACLPLPVSTAQTHAGAAVLRGVCFYNFQASMSANRFVMCAIVNDGVLSEERPPLCSPVPSSHWQRPGMRCPVGCGPALPSQRDPAEGVSSTVCSLLTISARRAHLSARCLSCISSSMTFPSTAPRSACCTCSISWSPTCGGEAMPHAVQVNCPQLNCRYCNC